MRSVRRFTQLLFTLIGTGLALYAVMQIDALYDRMLVSVLGLLLMQVGIWQLTASFLPNQREYRPLRKETDYFLSLLRRMNRAAVAAENGSSYATTEVERLHTELHHSVDRMLRLAGRTEEHLGFRYRAGNARSVERLTAHTEPAAHI
jgi:hypothetical protein